MFCASRIYCAIGVRIYVMYVCKYVHHILSVRICGMYVCKYVHASYTYCARAVRMCVMYASMCIACLLRESCMHVCHVCEHMHHIPNMRELLSCASCMLEFYYSANLDMYHIIYALYYLAMIFARSRYVLYHLCIILSSYAVCAI